MTDVLSRLKSVVLIGLFLLVTLRMPATALAHGSSRPRLNNVSAGPFQITVWTSPDPVRVGELHVAIIVNDTPTGDSATDLGIKVEVAAPDTAPMVAVATQQQNFLQTYYESYFTLASVGQRQVTITVADAAGSGAVVFAMDVFEKQQLPGELFLGIGLLLVVGLGVLLSLYINPSQHPRSSPERRSGG